MVNVTFYNCHGDRRFLNKYLNQVSVTTAELYDNTDIFTPELKVAWDNNYATTINYFYISDFKRYYFIEDVIAEPGGAARIKGSIDVLMTYNNSIKQDDIIITRAMNSGAQAPNLDAGGTSWNPIPIPFEGEQGPTYVKDNSLPLRPDRDFQILQFSQESPFVIGDSQHTSDKFFVLNVMGRNPINT